MSDNSGEMLAEIWVALKPYLDKKERADAAQSFVRVAEEYINLEIHREELNEAGTEINHALNELLGEDYEDEEEEDY